VDRDLAVFLFRLRGFVFHSGVERWLGANRFSCDPGGGHLAGFRPCANSWSLAPASAGGPPWPRPQAALARRNPVCEASCVGRRGRSSGWVPAPIYLGLCEANGLDRGGAAAGTLISANLGMALLVSIVHSSAMIAAGGLCARLVYRDLGLKFVARSWFNLETTWAATLILVGAISLAFCLVGFH
jgi:hypothetical protein